MNKSSISEEEYNHAKIVWDKFNIKNLKYTKLYNETVVLILANIFENIRDVCLKTYKLDPAWYFTAPGLSWDSMLKYKKVQLELLNDYNMILMLEKGLRGGISQCTKRYAKANNKHMKNYNPLQDSNYLMYLDANNLYGYAMGQCLPYGDFKWSDEYCEFDVDEWKNKMLEMDNNSDTGYILEVDLEYPTELHDYHKDLPLAPEGR